MSPLPKSVRSIRSATRLRSHLTVPTALALAVAAGIGLVPNRALAATSQLDRSFAAGERSFDVRGTDDAGEAVLARPNGRILVGGEADRANPTDFFDKDVVFIQRLANGGPDEAFGTHGQQLVSLPSGAVLSDFALDSDGSIVGLAHATPHDYLFKLKANGAPASGFGTNGVADLPGSPTFFLRIALQPDHKIVVAGRVTGTTEEVYVERLTANGAFDADIGLPFGSGDSGARAIDVSADGNRIAVAVDVADNGSGHKAIGALLIDSSGTTLEPAAGFGSAGNGTKIVANGGVDTASSGVLVTNSGVVTLDGFTGVSPRSAVVARLRANGTPDTNFNGNGRLSLAIQHVGFVNSLDRDGAGNLVLTGSTDENGVIAARVTSAGQPDASFGTGGATSFALPDFFEARDGTIAPDGSPIVVGTAQSVTEDLGVARLSPSGSPDPGFKPGGLTLYGLSGPSDVETADAVAVDDQGRIYTAGFTNEVPTGDFLVRRFLVNGERDLSWPLAGAADHTAVADARAHGIALSGNRAVVVGCASCGSNSVFEVVRYTPSGGLDSGFSGNGTVSVSFAAGASVARDVAVQSNGRVVVAGTAGSLIALARFTSGGILDNSFSGDGKQTTSFPGLLVSATGVAVQSDGRIVVAGTQFVSSGERLAVARYLANGTLDQTFGTGGRVTTSFPGDNVEAAAVTIRPDGRIIVVGHANGSTSGVAIARYRTDGSLDTTFNNTGRLVVGSAEDGGNGVAADGNRIVVAALNDSGTGSFKVTRLLGNGSADTTFSGDGIEMTPPRANQTISDVAGTAIDPDGRIVVAGTGTTANGGTVVALARYSP